jgi:hypothetical protein
VGKLIRSTDANLFSGRTRLAARAARPGGEAPFFDQLFVELKARHHKGAVAMANSELRHGSDLRLRLMAHAIRHEQQGEIALMQGVNGGPALHLALQNMLADNVIPTGMERFIGTPVERISAWSSSLQRE